VVEIAGDYLCVYYFKFSLLVSFETEELALATSAVKSAAKQFEIPFIQEEGF
jgi:hypothetical protein